MQDHLKWGFMILSAEGYLELSERSWIPMADLPELMTFCAGNVHTAQVILDHVDKAKAKLPLSLFAHERLTFHAFEQLLVQLVDQRVLFERGTTEFTSVYAQLSNPVVCQYLVSQNVERSNRQKLQKFLAQWRLCHARSALNAWIARTNARKQARAVLEYAFVTQLWNFQHQGFQKWQRVAICSVCASEIQRFYRGYRGRVEAAHVAATIEASYLIQKKYRERSSWLMFIKFAQLQARKAIVIQVPTSEYFYRTCVRTFIILECSLENLSLENLSRKARSSPSSTCGLATLSKRDEEDSTGATGNASKASLTCHFVHSSRF